VRPAPAENYTGGRWLQSLAAGQAHHGCVKFTRRF
jgi:hypothetical protein